MEVITSNIDNNKNTGLMQYKSVELVESPLVLELPPAQYICCCCPSGAGFPRMIRVIVILSTLLIAQSAAQFDSSK